MSIVFIVFLSRLHHHHSYVGELVNHLKVLASCPTRIPLLPVTAAIPFCLTLHTQRPPSHIIAFLLVHIPSMLAGSVLLALREPQLHGAGLKR